jgi:transposase
VRVARPVRRAGQGNGPAERPTPRPGPIQLLPLGGRSLRSDAGQRPPREELAGSQDRVSDAAWLAQLGAHGLVRDSFVPPEPIRQLRDLTRTTLVRARAKEIQRLEKLLEDAGIKLSSVATDISGVSGRAMLEALIDGQRDPGLLADLAKRRLRSKIPELTEALTGRFSEHHGFLAQIHLDLIDNHTLAIDELTARIEVVVEPFRHVRDLLVTIPGISTPWLPT